jgi:hypothetical protein
MLCMCCPMLKRRGSGGGGVVAYALSPPLTGWGCIRNGVRMHACTALYPIYLLAGPRPVYTY